MSEKKGGYLIYRCGLCEQHFEDGHVPDISLAMNCLIVYGSTPPEWGIIASRFTMHYHNPEEKGFGYFVGVKAD